jgi:hypothetical protein
MKRKKEESQKLSRLSEQALREAREGVSLLEAAKALLRGDTIIPQIKPPHSPEVPRREAAVIATTVIETPLSLEITETPPFPPESLLTETPVTAVASTEVPRSPEEPTQP